MTAVTINVKQTHVKKNTLLQKDLAEATCFVKNLMYIVYCPVYGRVYDY